MSWKPIETAPKDGTEVLGYASGSAEFMTPIKFLRGEWVCSWNHTDVSCLTHWQPLPPPPNED